jgi:hypothetical protein
MCPAADNVLVLQAVNIQATDMAYKCGADVALASIDEALPWYLKVDSLTWQVRFFVMMGSIMLC